MYTKNFGTLLVVATTFTLILAAKSEGTRSPRSISSIVSQLLFGDEAPETMQMQTITKTAAALNDGQKVLNQQVKFALRPTPEHNNNNYKPGGGYGFQSPKLPTHDMTTAKPQAWLNLPVPFLTLSYEKIEEPEIDESNNDPTKSKFPLITDYKPQNHQIQGSHSYQNSQKDFDDIDGLRPPTFSENNFVSSYDQPKPIMNDISQSHSSHMSYDPPRHRPRPHHHNRGRRPPSRPNKRRRRRRRRRKNGRPKRRRQHHHNRRVEMDHHEMSMMQQNSALSGGRRRSLQL